MNDGHMISVLSGGRKRRRRHRTPASRLWVAAAGFASFVPVALVLVRTLDARFRARKDGRETELVDTAERLEHAYDREARIVALDVPDREAIQ